MLPVDRPGQASRHRRQGRRVVLLIMRTHVLILCTHNSARSVLGEGMLKH
jgi:hypothetical protein